MNTIIFWGHAQLDHGLIAVDIFFWSKNQSGDDLYFTIVNNVQLHKESLISESFLIAVWSDLDYCTV